MNENGILIDGKVAKRVNFLLEEYMDIKAKENDLEESRKKVLAELFELTEVGKQETGKYVFNIVDNKGTVRVSTKALKEQMPEVYEQIEENGLLSVGENYLTVRGIKLKGSRA